MLDTYKNRKKSARQYSHNKINTKRVFIGRKRRKINNRFKNFMCFFVTYEILPSDSNTFSGEQIVKSNITY